MDGIPSSPLAPKRSPAWQWGSMSPIGLLKLTPPVKPYLKFCAYESEDIIHNRQIVVNSFLIVNKVFVSIFNLFYWLSYYLIFCLLLFSDNIKTSWFLRSLPRKNHSVEYLRKFSEVYIVF